MYHVNNSASASSRKKRPLLIFLSQKASGPLFDNMFVPLFGDEGLRKFKDWCLKKAIYDMIVPSVICRHQHGPVACREGGGDDDRDSLPAGNHR